MLIFRQTQTRKEKRLALINTSSRANAAAASARASDNGRENTDLAAEKHQSVVAAGNGSLTFSNLKDNDDDDSDSDSDDSDSDSGSGDVSPTKKKRKLSPVEELKKVIDMVGGIERLKALLEIEK